MGRVTIDVWPRRLSRDAHVHVWHEQEHPREKGGGKTAGQFASGSGSSAGSSAKAGEPDDVKQMRERLTRYESRGSLTAAEEKARDLYRRRLAADPSKWKPGQGVKYSVASGGRHSQWNGGFRIIAVDATGLKAKLRQVADTGLTSTGGNEDRFGDEWHYLGDLKRDKAHDGTAPPVGAEPAKSQQSAPAAPTKSNAELLEENRRVLEQMRAKSNEGKRQFPAYTLQQLKTSVEEHSKEGGNKELLERLKKEVAAREGGAKGLVVPQIVPARR